MYQVLYNQLKKHPVWSSWLETLPNQVNSQLDHSANGNLPAWRQAVNDLPEVTASQININQGQVTAGKKSDCDPSTQQEIQSQLKKLKPWRKGPYRLFDISIDTEWRSDWKWDRLCEHINPLKNKTVLDVGCGNGYHSWRMAGLGAELVIGIDPSLLFTMQFHAIKKYIPDANVFILPFRLEDMPSNLAAFDTVFSMGVLYHRKSPFDHLMGLRQLLKPGGELILETLIVPGNENTVLVPKDRYAQMNNVWFLPSPDCMLQWLSKSGFNNPRLININQTSVQEQRSTEWMEFESLETFLDPHDDNLTIEGYPAPRRAIFIAEKP